VSRAEIARIGAAPGFRAYGNGATWQGACPTCGYGRDKPDAPVAGGFVGTDGEAGIWCEACRGERVRHVRGTMPDLRRDGRPAPGAGERSRWSVSGEGGSGRTAASSSPDADRDAAIRDRLKRASKLWKQARPILNRHGGGDLRGRGILRHLPPSLRYLDRCRHDELGAMVPAIIVCVTHPQTVRFSGVHRTVLHEDAAPRKKVPGPVSGGVGMLHRSGIRPEQVPIGEGNTLAASEMLRMDSCCATLSAAGMAALGETLPDYLERITVARDNDPPGPNGRRPGPDAAERLAAAATARGLSSHVTMPSTEGMDFNDLLRLARQQGKVSK
jgi:hypothetical protein